MFARRGESSSPGLLGGFVVAKQLLGRNGRRRATTFGGARLGRVYGTDPACSLETALTEDPKRDRAEPPASAIAAAPAAPGGGDAEGTAASLHAAAATAHHPPG